VLSFEYLAVKLAGKGRAPDGIGVSRFRAKRSLAVGSGSGAGFFLATRELSKGSNSEAAEKTSFPSKHRFSDERFVSGYRFSGTI
jgi:hypothetical protein